MGRVRSYRTFPPLPHESGAVSLCCTFPEVAFGGRYPLSLPCGARTFLTRRPFDVPGAIVQLTHESYYTALVPVLSMKAKKLRLPPRAGQKGLPEEETVW